MRGLPLAELVAVTATVRPGPVTRATAATKLALRALALRFQMLGAELAALGCRAGPAHRGSGAWVLCAPGIGH